MTRDFCSFKTLHRLTCICISLESPRRYVESDVNIHYRCPVRQDPLPLVPERELARQQAEHMKRLYREQRRNKYLQVLATYYKTNAGTKKTYDCNPHYSRFLEFSMGDTLKHFARFWIVSIPRNN